MGFLVIAEVSFCVWSIANEYALKGFVVDLGIRTNTLQPILRMWDISGFSPYYTLYGVILG